MFTEHAYDIMKNLETSMKNNEDLPPLAKAPPPLTSKVEKVDKDQVKELGNKLRRYRKYES